MAQNDEQIKIELLGNVFPFTFVLNTNGIITFATSSISRHVVSSGDNFFNAVTVEAPKISDLNVVNLSSGKMITFLVNKTGLRIKGVFVELNSNSYCFMGAVCLSSADEVIKFGLKLNDFTAFESVFDNLLLLQVQQKTIADLKAAQKELISERAKSIQNAKLVSLGEMSAGIAHEINNPLAVIQAKANLLLRQLSEPEKVQDAVARINKACSRIAKIINGLQKFSRSGATVSYEILSVSKIINEALVLTESNAKRFSVPIQTEFLNEHAILCNDVEIEQVFINLINNSIDAVKLLDEKWIHISVESKDSFVVVRFKDSGPGIPKGLHDKLFQPFFTTKPVGEGTGLGLSITKGILDEHKATILIDETCANTCFEIRFQKSEK